MDYNHNFGGIFSIVNMDRLENNKNSFNKNGYVLQLLVKGLYPFHNHMKILLLISKAYKAEF